MKTFAKSWLLVGPGGTEVLLKPMRVGDKAYILYLGRAKVHDQQLRHPELPCPEPAAGIGIAEIDPELLDVP